MHQMHISKAWDKNLSGVEWSLYNGVKFYGMEWSLVEWRLQLQF
jgi:hypothetical protein